MNTLAKPAADPASETKVTEALERLDEMFNAIYAAAHAVNLITREPWRQGRSADTARNSIEWLSEQMTSQINDGMDALDALKEEIDRRREASTN